jgi:hypothetical protein
MEEDGREDLDESEVSVLWDCFHMEENDELEDNSIG